MRWELVGRYSKFSEEAELTKPPWPAAAEKGDVAIWPHGRIESNLSFVYRLSREHDPAIVGMLSVLRDHWQIEGASSAGN